jgi:curved DNA-binding protein CbpA
VLDYYAILGLTKSATATEIKSAYLKLARQYHPDRFQTEKEKKEANDHFTLVTQAYKVLSAEKSKQEYDQSLHLDASGNPVEGATLVQARNAFKRALVLLKQRDFWRAANLLRMANRYDPDKAVYLSYLGLALVHTRQYAQEGFEKLHEAVKKELFNPAIYINLALAYEKTGDVEKATYYYREALNWDPKNETAIRELARLNNQGKKGFLGRLFGGG